MDWLGSKLGYKNMEDWYALTLPDLENFSQGYSLVSKYGSSP